ncbi:hypothetical protein [Catenuloplanes atrovinosus]|uniref:Uncharacterized protein n=1 Tax=Catenuloplanes atrovinosus TaxID=137266 RepID=A0AAE3YUX5_9ACTN|nr:hypothetical protein [Catenuloplanes atrovinosus]MDR7278889.1 hypothetical protein [Catenuloplanes atrovinosus]
MNVTIAGGDFSMAGNEHEVNRSTKSGRFVKQSTAERQPDTTVTEQVGGDHTGGDREVNRSASTGRFVRETTAELHPATTETQRV